MSKKKQNDANPYGDRFAAKKGPRLRPLYPVIGLIVAALAAGVAYFAAEPAWNLVLDLILNGQSNVNENTMILATGLAIFLMMVMVFAATFALITPSAPKLVNEDQLKKEKDDREREKRRARQRQKAMRAKMKAANKDEIEF